MKKRMIGLVLGMLVIGSSMGAFAAEEPVSQNKVGMRWSNLSVEERMTQKNAHIDELVKNGEITKEEGDQYKKVIEERMKECTTPGENRDQHERLGLGFGKGQGKGNGQGRGC
ncbi:hypothetical protein [Inediibacterium massiliense]|uniref:hypothetical protein n=1 Tax=Inediibacterium massiliense TaxID=1658111 RepID=UPI0006B671BD|nr:hypothetical protein [Inediibacterium massiliense]